MAYTLDEMQADRDRLWRNMAKGIKRGRMNGEEVEFRDLKDMERTIALLDGKITDALGQSARKRIAYPQTSTGWR